MSNDPYAAPQEPRPTPDGPPAPAYGSPPAFGAPPSIYSQPTYPTPVYGQPGYGAPGYGAPPTAQPTYGPPAYGQPATAQPPYGQPAYGQPAYAQPVPGAPTWNVPATGDVYGRPLAGWWSRVGAFLLDQLIVFVPWTVLLVYAFVTSVPAYDRYGRPTTELTTAGWIAMLLAYVLLVGIWGWNRWFRQGRTGQSLGKQALGIRLVHQDTGQPAGRGRAFGRDLVHLAIDGWFYLGYLWPLWDVRKQTWSDKACSTVVVRG